MNHAQPSTASFAPSRSVKAPLSAKKAATKQDKKQKLDDEKKRTLEDKAKRVLQRNKERPADAK